MIKRTIYPSIFRHLKAKEITIITGARQIGKTTLLKQISKELVQQNKKIQFFNLDIPSDNTYFANQENLLQKIKLEIGTKGGYIFIDEIQRKENAGLFLKGLYDRDLPYKWIVSGSGSLELKEKIQESLAGRKRMFEMYPVTFAELLHYKTDYKYESDLSAYLTIEHQQVRLLLKEYLNYGGYPRIVTEESSKEKRLLLEEIFRSYIERDITTLLSLNRPDAFTLLIRLLADRIGSPINYSTLSNQTGISLPTLKKYLWYAEKTFIIKIIRPFFRNVKKELTKTPIAYFVDLGLRNYSLGLLGNVGEAHNSGLLFENFIFQILYEKASNNGWQVKYWRTKDKAEVDFVLDKGFEVVPIEVKYQELKRPTISRSFRSFMEKYQPKKAYLVNLSLETELEIENTKVNIIPYYKLLELDF